MKYQKTVILESVQQLDSLHIGQWVQFGLHGHKAQYFGTTFTGTDVLRHGKFSKENAKRNKLLRSYAKQYGSK